MELFDRSKKSMEDLLTSNHYTPEELAILLDMHVNVIRTACHEGRLQAKIVSHHILTIERNDVLAWLESS